MKRVAILVDGGFYRKVSKHLWGEKPPEERAMELVRYCRCHLRDLNSYRKQGEKRMYDYNELYRIFYYDCPPTSKTIYNPLTGKNFSFGKTPTYTWMNRFLAVLKQQRKVALRMGFLGDEEMHYIFPNDVVKRLCKGTLKIEDIREDDLVLNMRQKGVDMKIGIDIATLAYKRLVHQIVLVSGDSDFIPAAKLARTEGIDFILDSLGMHIHENLAEHIDGLRTYSKKNCKQRQALEE